MSAIDSALIEKARPHFLDAIASFGRPGGNLYDVAREIAQRAKLAGFSKRGRRFLLDYLCAFVDDLLLKRIDPYRLGKPVEDPSSLFSHARLRSIFDPDAAPAQSELPLQSAQEERERALIEQLIAATRLYETSKAVQELMDFTIRLRAFAPFNAMLLHIQKPGLTYAATAADWHRRFGRAPNIGARPLLVLRAMGPVDFVFDIQDTDGHPVPESAFRFPTLGSLTAARLNEIVASVRRDGIDLVELDAGEARAGWIRLVARSPHPKGRHRFQLAFNRNHPVPTRAVTIAHELAHLYLGHLGEDQGRSIRDRRDRNEAQRELEAEMVAYLVARRSGLTPRSESYLSTYQGAFAEIDLYAVMRVSNAVEAAMGIASHQIMAEMERGA